MTRSQPDSARDLLKLIDYALDKDSLTYAERVDDARQLVKRALRIPDEAVAPLNREQIARTIAKHTWCGATYDDATEAEKDAFVNAADAVLALPSEAIGRDRVIAQCAIIALEQRCERGTPWDLACTTIAEKIRALLVSRPHQPGGER